MIKAIVTDIEGTTTSIDFVYDVLFPYAREHLGAFVRRHAKDLHVASYIQDVCAQTQETLDIDKVITQLETWMAEDKKVTVLKGLQGLVWEAGYKNGDFTGHVYADAYENLQAWHDQGLALYVYSSGSVKAQQLLFGYTRYGDLNPLFSGYFDTTTGAKTEASSYQQIALQAKLPASQMLFLSDIDKELEAAQQAGMHTRWLVRDCDPDGEAAFQQVRDFNEIKFTV